jgi:cell division protein ZipA
MDATTLRIVLFVAGLIFIGGIYLYETRRRKRESAQARRRVSSRVERSIEHEETEPAEHDGWSAAEADASGLPQDDYDKARELRKHSAFDEEPEELGSMTIDDEPIPGIDAPDGRGIDATEEAMAEDGIEAETESETESEFRAETKQSRMEQQELFGFSAQEESPVDVPDLIIQINVRARKPPFDGPAIVKAMQETGLHLSSQAVYQRLASDGTKKVLYSVASMVNPGVFPVKAMDEFTTPGLTLFTQLPGPADGMLIFSDMLYTAERLAAMLVGDLQDETHSALTKQTIEHLRERIMEHKRQIQLARRKG